MANSSVSIIAHTHWDREWYRTFQDYRLRLLDVMDDLLDILTERPDYASFLLDGQTILLEDYLALRPERVGDIRRLVQAGRLEIGPWYVQPDEFLVVGEALIRNLTLGKMSAAPFGGACQCGWLPDTFGHIAQLPQILANFDIDSLVFARGLGDEPVRPSGAFWLVATSGHRALALHQFGGYVNAGNLGHRSFWGRVDPTEVDLALAAKQIERLLSMLDPNDCGEPVAVWNGADHTPPQRSLPEIIAHLARMLPHRSFAQTSLRQHLDTLKSSEAALPEVQGELRGSKYQPVLNGVLSARMPLKQANARVERGLLRYAEPLAALAWLEGEAYPAAGLWAAWRLVLQNQCHDSICGCHIDRVTDEMMGRHRQAEDLVEALVGRAAGFLAQRNVTGAQEAGRYPLLVVNTFPQRRSDVIQARLRLPSFRPPYCVSNGDGSKRPVQVTGHTLRSHEWLDADVTVEEFLALAPMWRASLEDIDGLALSSYSLERQDERIRLTLWLGEHTWGDDHRADALLEEAATWPGQARVRLQACYHEVEVAFEAHSAGLGCAAHVIHETAEAVMPSERVIAGPRMLENQAVRVEVDPRGAITLTDLASGRAYGPLCLLEDSADAGDTYDYCPVPDLGVGICSAGVPLIKVIESGPERAALRIESWNELPEGLAADRKSRSSATRKMRIVSILRLSAGSPIVEVSVNLDNVACDHRLRALFRTGITAEDEHAGGQFGVSVRPVVPLRCEGWCQQPVNTRPHTNWFGVVDDTDGLMILSEGLPEHEPLYDDGQVTLALTLLRCVGELSRGDLITRKGHAGPAMETPGAQCLGEHTYRYGILPVQRPDLPGISNLAEMFTSPRLVVPSAPAAALSPAADPIATLSPDFLVLSSLKVSEDCEHLVMRVYNPTTETVQAAIAFGRPMRSVQRGDAAENILEQLAIVGKPPQCRLDVRPAEIVTLLVTP